MAGGRATRKGSCHPGDPQGHGQGDPLPMKRFLSDTVCPSVLSTAGHEGVAEAPCDRAWGPSQGTPRLCPSPAQEPAQHAPSPQLVPYSPSSKVDTARGDTPVPWHAQCVRGDTALLRRRHLRFQEGHEAFHAPPAHMAHGSLARVFLLLWSFLPPPVKSLSQPLRPIANAASPTKPFLHVPAGWGWRVGGGEFHAGGKPPLPSHRRTCVSSSSAPVASLHLSFCVCLAGWNAAGQPPALPDGLEAPGRSFVDNVAEIRPLCTGAGANLRDRVWVK